MFQPNTKKATNGKKSNAVLPCLFPSHLYHERHALGRPTELVPLPTRCGWCWGCETTRINDLIGRVCAQMIGCTHADLLTLTYDGKRGLHERASARIRNVKDLQDFKKRVRQREHRGLVAYNKREIVQAKEQGRAPQLVDASKSYIKFLDVHEYGGKKKRSHFHVLMMYESHFSIPQDVWLAGDIPSGMQTAKRIWDFKRIYGPRALHRGLTECDNPDLIDFRVDEDANQEFAPWPHGQTNIKCVTHETQAGDTPVLKRDNGIGLAVKYLNKYLNKNPPFPKDFPTKQQQWTPEQADLYASLRKKNVQKTMSQGIGFQYAYAFGQKHGENGIPMNDMLYQINGVNRPRSVLSTEKQRQKMLANGLNEFQSEMMIDRRMIFEMRGAMANAAFDGMFDAWKKKGREPSEQQMGKAYLKALYKYESDKARELLKSHEAAVLRTIGYECPTIPKLPDFLTPIHCYETVNGVLKDGIGKDYGRRTYRPPQDRLAERRAEIKAIHDKMNWLKAQPQKMEKLKTVIGRMPLSDLLTEERFKRRPLHVRERYRREADIIHLFHVLEKLGEDAQKAAAAGNHEEAENLWDERDYIQGLNEINERDEFALPRYTVSHDSVTTDLLLRWINSCDDFGFPKMKEQLIQKYCHVQTIADGVRLVTSPRGETFLQRWHSRSGENRLVYDENAEKGHRDTLVHKDFPKWHTRAITFPDEMAMALDNKLVVAKEHVAPIFYGNEPFRL